MYFSDALRKLDVGFEKTIEIINDIPAKLNSNNYKIKFIEED